MDRPQSLQADRVVELGGLGIEHGSVGHVDAARPPVAAVQADAQPVVVVGRVHERRQLLGITPDRAARAGRVLQEQVGRAGARGRGFGLAGCNRTQACFRDPVDAARQAAVGTLVRAGMEDHHVEPSRAPIVIVWASAAAPFSHSSGSSDATLIR